MKTRFALFRVAAVLVLCIQGVSANEIKELEYSVNQLSTAKSVLINRESRLKVERDKLQTERETLLDALATIKDRLTVVDIKLCKIDGCLGKTSTKIKRVELALNSLK